MEMPIVDCSPISGLFEHLTNDDFNILADEIGSTMSETGVCYLVNHGVDLKKVDHIYNLSTKFFGLPTEIKQQYKKKDANTFHGYLGPAGPGVEALNETDNSSTDIRESWDIWGIDGLDANKYPNEEVPGFQKAFEDVRPEYDNLTKKILRCLELFLKLEDNALISMHRNIDDRTVKNQTVVRSMFYNVLDKSGNIPPDEIRCGEHSDWGTITFLHQDMTGGLEVKTLSGEWIPANPVPDSLILLGAQIFETWTAGRIRAIIHRVRGMTAHQTNANPRQSFMHFLNPDGDAKVCPIVPIPLSEQESLTNSSKDESVNAYDYFQKLYDIAVAY